MSGTFTIDQINQVLDEAVKLESVTSICFEGGEPFLFYPLMLEGVKQARKRDLRVIIVSNSYWATSEADARIWLEPLLELGISDLSISDDSFHGDEEATRFARNAIKAAKEMGFPIGSICIEEPSVDSSSAAAQKKGEPIIGGDVVMRGRAADKLTEGLPRRECGNFTECTREELEKPGRVHVDTYGHVHVCQGISIGNMWETPLSELITNYNAHQHPICSPILKGGPLELANRYDVKHDADYVDECHFCFNVRRSLIDKFPQYLAPRQVYGLEDQAAKDDSS
jgi:hypothetical protein